MRYQYTMVIGVLAVLARFVPAADRYVSVNGTDSGPFTNWATAANSIQLAVDVATNDGDTVWVSNGTYVVTNQINVTSKIKVRSVNGHALTAVCADWPTTTNRCFYVGGGAVVDGFTVTNGHWNSSLGGAGAFVTGGALMQNCLFVNNSAVEKGGGVYAEYGGTISNCTVSVNSVTDEGGKGGGVFLVYGGKALECTITGNTTYAKGVGGGVYVSGSTQTNIIRGGLIAGNWAAYGGGGAYIYDAVQVEGVVISNNTSSHYSGGGGVFITGKRALIANCTIIDNTSVAVGGGGIGFGTGGTVVDCLIARNQSNAGGSGRWGGGGVWLGFGGVLDRCRIIGNTCKGISNLGGGGGVLVVNAGTIVNSLICNNTNLVAAGHGGGVLLNATAADVPTILNCTIVDNYSANEGGGTAALAAPIYVANSIIVRNGSQKNVHPDLYNAVELGGYYWHCCVNAPVTPLPQSQGNITGAPVFLAAGEGNFRLRRHSPGINAGMSGAWVTGTDLDGKPRVSPIYNGTVDMGAYEYAFPPGNTIMVIR